MTSSNFQLTGSVSQISIGTSSATNFNVSGGFLYFPLATVPVLTPTAGDAQVDFTWTISVGFVGWLVSNYNVGQATVSGGPYSYSSVGSTTSATISSLSNGTAYYFVIRPEDAFGRSLATSTEVSATPTAAAVSPTPPPAPVGGGGIILDLLKRFLPPLLPREIVELFPPEIPVPCPYPRQDLNCDGRIDLQDLSIFLFLTPEPAPNPADFNDDTKIDTRDLSSLFFAWTERLLTFGPDGQKIVRQLTDPETLEREDRGGFLERLFGLGDDPTAQVVAVEEPAEDEIKITTRISDFFIWLFISIMEFIIGAIKWVLNVL